MRWIDGKEINIRQFTGRIIGDKNDADILEKICQIAPPDIMRGEFLSIYIVELIYGHYFSHI